MSQKKPFVTHKFENHSSERKWAYFEKITFFHKTWLKVFGVRKSESIFGLSKFSSWAFSSPDAQMWWYQYRPKLRPILILTFKYRIGIGASLMSHHFTIIYLFIFLGSSQKEIKLLVVIRRLIYGLTWLNNLFLFSLLLITYKLVTVRILIRYFVGH